MSESEINKAVIKECCDINKEKLSAYINEEKLQIHKCNGEIEDIRRNKPDFTRYEGIITCDEYIANNHKYIEKLWFKEIESYIKCPMALC